MENNREPSYKKIIIIATIIAALTGIYKGVTFFGDEYEAHIDKHIERKLVEQDQKIQSELDSALGEIRYYIELDTKRDNILVNIVLAETEPKRFGRYKFYQTNPNSLGHFHLWHKTEELGKHNIVYEAVYNPTENCYGYLDRFNKYYLLQVNRTGLTEISN